MPINVQIIAPGEGDASYVSPKRKRTAIAAFSVRNPTGSPVTCTVSINGNVIDSESVLAGMAWIPSKVIRQTLEPKDILQFSGTGVFRMASGYVEGIR